MDTYLQILLECLHKASVVPFASDTTIYAMKAFGGHDMTAPVILAVIGASLGQIFNWYLGRFMFMFEWKGKLRVNPHNYERIRHYFDKYGFWLLLFAFLPLANLLTVAAGFFNISLKKTLPLIVIGTAVHYGWAIL